MVTFYIHICSFGWSREWEGECSLAFGDRAKCQATSGPAATNLAMPWSGPAGHHTLSLGSRPLLQPLTPLLSRQEKDHEGSTILLPDSGSQSKTCVLTDPTASRQCRPYTWLQMPVPGNHSASQFATLPSQCNLLGHRGQPVVPSLYQPKEDCYGTGGRVGDGGTEPGSSRSWWQGQVLGARWVGND